MTSQSLSEKAVTGASLVFGSRIAIIFLRFVNLAILARLLTPEEFGVATAATIVIGGFSILSGLGLGPALTQRLHVESSELQAVFYFMLVTGIVLSLLVVSLRGVCAELLSVPQVEEQLKVLCFSFLFAPFFQISQALLQRSLKFKQIAIGNLSSYFVGYLVVSITLAYMGFGAWAIIFAILGEQIVGSVIFYLLSPFSLSLPKNCVAVFGYLKFGRGITLSQIANYIALQADNFITLRFLGVGDLGIYSRAYQLVSSPAVLLGGTISSIIFPMLSKLQEDKKKLRNGYYRAIMINGILTIPPSIILVILADNIVEILLGENWGNVVKPLSILSIGLLFRAGYKVGQAILQAKGFVNLLAFQESTYAFAVVFGSLVGQKWGIVGVSYGVLSAVAINYVLSSIFAMKITGLKWNEFMAAHSVGFKIGIVVGAFTWVINAICILFAVPKVVPVILTFAVCGLSILIIYKWYPSVLGGDCQIAFSMIKKRITRRNK